MAHFTVEIPDTLPRIERYRKIAELIGLRQEQIASDLNLSRVYVTRTLSTGAPEATFNRIAQHIEEKLAMSQHVNRFDISQAA